MILTPDQRLRVFISSTLQELADERAAARAAIESLRFTPVMFELGARPHAPRALYRSYIEQSDIFIGIYGASYGWVAPDMEVSGLEDEFNLSQEMPRLIYVKNGEPEDRLRAMLDRIASAGISYRRFDTADELKGLIENDLMVLISERFEPAGSAAPVEPATQPRLPAPMTKFIGRKREVKELATWLSDAEIRLITLIGPGGIGKTRLALEAARAVEAKWRDGTFFVPLASIRDPQLVPDAIARALGARSSGDRDPLDDLHDFLADRDCVLILDNFEQLLDAAGVVSDLLATTPVDLLVTSRAPLRVRGEHVYDVEPLSLPGPEMDSERLAQFDAVRLFVDRARAVRHDFEETPAKLGTVAEICRRLDGLPLAIELAAVQMRILPPEGVLDRLTVRLKTLTGGARDMPERHQRLRDTIEWSYDLLDPAAKQLFARLAAFRGGFTLEAAEVICGEDLDVLLTLSALIDHSLVRNQSSGQTNPRFVMLETIREYAADLLSDTSENELVRDRHASFYSKAAIESRSEVGSARQQEVITRLDDDIDNLRAALAWMLERGDADRAAHCLLSTWWFWWSRGHLRDGRRWGERVLEHDLSPLGRARALAFEAGMAFWQSDYAVALPGFIEASELFAEANDAEGLALTDMALGLVEGFLGDFEKGYDRVMRAVRGYEEMKDRWGLVSALTSLGWLQSVLDRFDEDDQLLRYALDVATDLGSPADLAMAELNLARFLIKHRRSAEGVPLLATALERLVALRHVGAASNVLDAVAFAAAGQGRWDDALVVSAAADSVRTGISFENPAPHLQRVQQLRTDAGNELGTDIAQQKWDEGSALNFDEAVQVAEDVLRSLVRELSPPEGTMTEAISSTSSG